MPITVTERFESRSTQTGENAAVDLAYTVAGTDDDQAARAALESASPTSYPSTSGTLRRMYVTLEPLGPALWKGTAKYVSDLKAPQVGDNVQSFDTTGGTQLVRISKETVSKTGRFGDSAPDNHKMIEANEKHVAGTNIVVPVYTFQESHRLAVSTVTDAYRGLLFSLTGTVNKSAFRGCDVGECLFLGAGGSRRGANPFWEINFKFAASPNKENIKIGDITVPKKKGWEYLWVRTRPFINQEGTSRASIWHQPWFAYVEKVYDEGEWSGMGI
jgi:hypothetical protein